MISFPLSPKVVTKEKNKAVFEIHSLYPGYGVTIGNSLRRVLLSSLEGVAVTQVKIKGAAHEFSTVPGVLEDVIMILLNLKNLRFKLHDGMAQTVTLTSKGEGEVTGADFTLPSQVKLANPQQHIATITDKKTELEIEVTLEKGIGYEPKDQRKTGKKEIGAIMLDAIFTPIKNVNFQVESMRVGERTDFDKLSLEIETDGTLTPDEAFYQACDIILKHFTIIAGGKEAAPEVESEAPAKEAKKEAKKTSKKKK